MIDLEALAYWYFRINGCLTIQNFVVHPDIGRNQETDVDLIAVRFPFRKENLLRPMQDGDLFKKERERIQVLLIEAKAGLCDLNGPWTEPGRRNMERVVRAIGFARKDTVSEVAYNLYESGAFVDSLYRVRLLALGSRQNSELEQRLPQVPQLTWDGVCEFIFGRFTKYRNQKVSHPQWDEAGKWLWDVAMGAETWEEFRDQVLRGRHSPASS